MEKLIDFIERKEIVIVSHRGNSAEFIENTIPAFKSAIELNTDMIELDVNITNDKKLVCFHNTSIGDTPISSINWDDLPQETIPLLEDVVQQFGDSAYFVFEIKNVNPTNIDAYCCCLKSLFADNDLLNSVVIACDNIALHSHLKKYLGADFYFAWVYFSAEQQVDVPQLLRENNINAIICHISEAPYISSNIDSSIFIGVYGVENNEHITICRQYNIRLIGTDDPQKISKLLNTSISDVN